MFFSPLLWFTQYSKEQRKVNILSVDSSVTLTVWFVEQWKFNFLFWFAFYPHKNILVFIYFVLVTEEIGLCCNVTHRRDQLEYRRIFYMSRNYFIHKTILLSFSYWFMWKVLSATWIVENKNIFFYLVLH